MKKLLVPLMSLWLVFGCGNVLEKSKDKDKTTNVETSSISNYSKSSAVKISASISISGANSDTPTDEMNSDISKIKSLKVSIYDKDSKLINTLSMQKTDASLKGEVLKFENPFIALSEGSTKFNFAFYDDSNNKILETESTSTLEAKELFNVKAEIVQNSIKKDPEAKISSKDVNINKIETKNYKTGEFIVGLKEKMDTDKLKSLIEKSGIKVTSINQGFLNAYTVKFSSPDSVAEALILASQIKDLEYLEQNSIAIMI